MKSKKSANEAKKKVIEIQDVRNHAVLTGLSVSDIARKIGRSPSHVWRVLKDARPSTVVWEAIMKIPLNEELVGYAKQPVMSHAGMIPPNEVDCNGYAKKSVARKSPGKPGGTDRPDKTNKKI